MRCSWSCPFQERCSRSESLTLAPSLLSRVSEVRHLLFAVFYPTPTLQADDDLRRPAVQEDDAGASLSLGFLLRDDDVRGLQVDVPGLEVPGLLRPAAGVQARGNRSRAGGKGNTTCSGRQSRHHQEATISAFVRRAANTFERGGETACQQVEHPTSHAETS